MLPSRAAALLAPEPFKDDLLSYYNFGRVPKDPLLIAILTNDLQKTVALAGHDCFWKAVPATFMWLWQKDPWAKCYGSPEKVADWEKRHHFLRGAHN